MVENTKRSLKKELLEASVHFLKDHTTEELTMRKLAFLCGVTPHAIYNHFANKETLLYAVDEYLLEEMTQLSIKIMQDPNLDTPQKLYKMTLSFLSLYQHYPHFLKQVLHHDAHPSYIVNLKDGKLSCVARYTDLYRIASEKPDDDQYTSYLERIAFFSLVSGLPMALNQESLSLHTKEELIYTILQYYLNRIY